jgi:hypothetical protein
MPDQLGESSAGAGKEAHLRRTESERNWFLSVGLLLLLFAFFGALYLVEMSLGRWKTSIRLVRNPWETATRYIAISHFSVALLYTLTSRRMKSAGPRASFVLFLAIGGILCLAYARLGALSPFWAAALFYAYFVAHDTRDQLFFCRANGDAPMARPHESLISILRGSRSIRMIYAGTLGVLLLGLLVGGGYAIVILHVASWYVFTVRQLASRPSGITASTFSWSWLRSTVPGFTVLHAGSAVLFLVGGAVWAYGFGNDPALAPFAILLAPESFPFWTIAHVTVSFAPK